MAKGAPVSVATEKMYTIEELSQHGEEQMKYGRIDTTLRLLQTQYPLGTVLGDVIAEIRVDYGFITEDQIKQAFERAAEAAAAAAPPG